MVTVVDKEANDTSFDAIDALEELEIDDLDAIPEFIREDESNAHHLPAQPKQQGPKAPVAPQPASAQVAQPAMAMQPAPAMQTAPVNQQAPLAQPAPVAHATPNPVGRTTGPAVTQTMPALNQQAPVPMQPVAGSNAPSYSTSSPATMSAPAPNPFTAPPAPVAMDSFQSISPVTSSTLPAYSPGATLPPQTTSHRHHGLGSPLLDRHPGTLTLGDAPPSDELETLWPGVSNHQELGGIFQAANLKRTPSFYMMIGFMAGAVVSLLSVWGYSSVTTHLAKGNDDSGKEIVTKVQEAQKEQNLVVQNIDPNAEIVPISSTYEVKSGDTLVVIAMKNYKKVTPRLIDQIVKANGLKSANALRLGETLKLPNYRNQSSKLAHRTAEAAREKQVQ